MDLYQASSDLGNESDEPIELTLEQYEEAKAHYVTMIETADAARRLANHPDFKKLVMDQYLTSEPQRLAELMASGRLHPQSMDNCKEELAAIGKFRNFMKKFMQEGEIARNELTMLEEAREEVLEQERQTAAAQN